MAYVATAVDGYAENNEYLVKSVSIGQPHLASGRTHHYSDDFQETEPVLHLNVVSTQQEISKAASKCAYLAVGSDGNKVQCNHEKQENETDGPAGEVVCPVLQKQLKGNQIGGCRNSVVEPVIPGQSEAKRVIDKATRCVD